LSDKESFALLVSESVAVAVWWKSDGRVAKIEEIAEMAAARNELVSALAERIGTPPLTPGEIESILALAAATAHGTGDRTTATLAAFLAGIAAAAAENRMTALDEIRRYAAELAPAPEAA